MIKNQKIVFLNEITEMTIMFVFFFYNESSYPIQQFINGS